MALNVGELQAKLTLDDDMSPALAMAGKSMTDFGSKIDKIGDKTSKLGHDLLPLSAGLIAIGGASLTMAGKFEESMTKLVSIAGVAESELEGVKQAVFAISEETGVGPQMLADAMTKVSSTTNDTTKALEILNIAALGTKAGFGDTVQVAGALTAVVNSYAGSNLSAARAGDILAQAIKEGGAEAKELAPTLANVVPQAAMLGVSFEEVAANLATLTKLGVPTAEAVTQLSSVFTAMSKRTKEGEEALASIGMSYESLREKVGREGLQATLQDLNRAFAGNIDGLTDVFGRIEAVRNIMGTAGVQGEEYARVLDKIKHSSDGGKSALQEMADAMDKTTVQTWSELTSMLQRMAITVGNELAPSFQDMLRAAMPVIQWAIDAVKWFGQLPDPIKNVALAIGALGAVSAPALIALGGAMSGVGAAMKLGGLAVEAVSGMMFTLGNTVPVLTARLWLMDVAAKSVWLSLAGPVGIVAGIAAIGYAWGQYKEDWTRGFDVIIPGLGMMRDGIDQIKQHTNLLDDAWGEFVQGNFRKAITILDGFGRGTLPAVRDSMGNIMLDFKTNMPAALKPLETGLYAVGGASVVMGDGLDSAKTRGEQLQARLKKTREEVDAFTASEKANIAAAHEQKLSISEIATELNLTEEAVQLYVDRLDDSKKSMEENDKAANKLAQQVRALNNELGVEHMNAIAAAMAAEKAWMKKLADDALTGKIAMEDLAFATEAVFKAAGDKNPFAGAGWSLGQMLPPWMLKDSPTEALPGLDLGKGILESLEDSMSKVPDILIKAFTGGGGISGALSAMGTLVGSGVGEKLGKKLGESISGIASFAGPMGAAIGALAGPMIEMFTKMLDKTAKGIKKTADGYGVEIGEQVVNAIKASMKELDMGQQEATIFNADKLFPTVTVSNFSDALRIVHDSFSMVATGQFDVAQGAKVVDSMWKKLADVGTDASGRISSGLKEIIQLNAQYGTQSKEIAKFLEDQSKAAGAAFTSIVKGSKDAFDAIDKNRTGIAGVSKEIDTLKQKHAEQAAAGTLTNSQQLQFTTDIAAKYEQLNSLVGEQTGLTAAYSGELENLGIIAVATYGAAIEAGMSHVEALKLVAPGMKDLLMAYETLGINIENAGFQSLILASTILEENPYLVEAVGGLSNAMIALDNTGKMNAETFHAMQEAGMTMYTRLQAAVTEHGGAAEDALMPMQDYLHQAEIQAKNLGVPLDANTQMLIDQSKELGLWKEAGKSANEQLLDGINALNSTMRELVNNVSGIAGGLRSIPSQVTSSVLIKHHTEYSESTVGGGGGGGGGNHAAGGGLVTANGILSYLAGGVSDIWKPHGSDRVPAMLTPGERVLTVSQNHVYEREMRDREDPRTLTALNRLTDAITSQADTLLIGLRDVLLERG